MCKRATISRIIIQKGCDVRVGEKADFVWL